MSCLVRFWCIQLLSICKIVPPVDQTQEDRNAYGFCYSKNADLKDHCFIKVWGLQCGCQSYSSQSGELLSLENPRNVQLIKTYSHLREVEMDDTDAKQLCMPELKPMHDHILGITENLQLNVPSLDGPFFPQGKNHTTHMPLTQTSQLDYEELCRLVILGLVDTPHHL